MRDSATAALPLADGDVAEAEAAVERLAAAPAEEGLVRYRDMAKTLGFQGHIDWAEAIP